MKLTSRQRAVDINRLSPFLIRAPFWFTLIVWSLLPSTKVPWLEIESIPINFRDIINIAVAFFYLLVPAINNRPIKYCSKGWHYYLPLVMIFLLGYAALSCEWSGLHNRDLLPMLYTLIVAASAFLLGYNVINKRSPEAIHQFLWSFTVYIAAVSLLYSATSFLSLGLGGEGDDTASEFGIKRVKGPLYEASTGYFLIVPALAFSLQEILKSPKDRILKAGVLFSLMLTLFGMGSRAGLLVFFLFFLLVILFLKNKKQAMIALSLMLVITTLAGLLFFSKAKTDRLQSLEDDTRGNTYSASLQIIQNRDDSINFFGSGYGSYWPWYIPDVEGARETDQYFDLVWNPYAQILYHPHSTFLLLIVELGIPGLFYFLFLWGILGRLLLGNLWGAEFPIFNCGIFASGVSMFFDFFIFKGPQLNTMWWIYFFGALALNATGGKSAKSSKNDISKKGENEK
ncbi:MULTISPECIES: O-antigen ligase family protein [unclassified Microcoleus]|uniref:O-antigen ligase family protein n=1 Tax=unclassified Microcoleus TaxID=2642155 RepID=UPI002FD27BB5